MDEFSISNMKDDRFSREELGSFASELLGFFEREGIDSKRSLDGKVGTFDSKIYPGGKIKVESSGHRLYVISYAIPGKGTPIKIDVDLEHYSMTVECSREIEGYGPLEENPIGNFIQTKRLGRSLKGVEKELEALVG